MEKLPKINVYTRTIFQQFFVQIAKRYVVGKFRMSFENKTNALIKEEML